MEAQRRGRPAKITEHTRKLQELWLRAAESPVEITCETKAAAFLIRFQLYNAVRAVRGQPELNPELAAVLEVVQVSLRGEGQNILRIGRSEAADKLNEVFSSLGITGNAAGTKSEADLRAEESERRIREVMGRLEDAKAAPRATPYYTRET